MYNICILLAWADDRCRRDGDSSRQSALHTKKNGRAQHTHTHTTMLRGRYSRLKIQSFLEIFTVFGDELSFENCAAQEN